LLRPQSIGHGELVVPFLPALVEGRGDRAEGRMEVFVRKREPQRLLHLASGLAPGSSRGHGERRGDAVGGEEQVPGALADLSVELEREAVVPSDQVCLLWRSGGTRRRWLGGPGGPRWLSHDCGCCGQGRARGERVDHPGERCMFHVLPPNPWG